MPIKTRLQRLEKKLSVGDEKLKTCLVEFDWLNDDGTVDHIEIRMTPAKYHRFCENLEIIYGSGAEQESSPDGS